MLAFPSFLQLQSNCAAEEFSSLLKCMTSWGQCDALLSLIQTSLLAFIQDKQHASSPATRAGKAKKKTLSPILAIRFLSSLLVAFLIFRLNLPYCNCVGSTCFSHALSDSFQYVSSLSNPIQSNIVQQQTAPACREEVLSILFSSSPEEEAAASSSSSSLSHPLLTTLSSFLDLISIMCMTQRDKLQPQSQTQSQVSRIQSNTIVSEEDCECILLVLQCLTRLCFHLCITSSPSSSSFSPSAAAKPPKKAKGKQPEKKVQVEEDEEHGNQIAEHQKNFVRTNLLKFFGTVQSDVLPCFMLFPPALLNTIASSSSSSSSSSQQTKHQLDVRLAEEGAVRYSVQEDCPLELCVRLSEALVLLSRPSSLYHAGFDRISASLAPLSLPDCLALASRLASAILYLLAVP